VAWITLHSKTSLGNTHYGACCASLALLYQTVQLFAAPCEGACQSNSTASTGTRARAQPGCQSLIGRAHASHGASQPPTAHTGKKTGSPVTDAPLTHERQGSPLAVPSEWFSGSYHAPDAAVSGHPSLPQPQSCPPPLTEMRFAGSGAPDVGGGASPVIAACGSNVMQSSAQFSPPPARREVIRLTPVLTTCTSVSNSGLSGNFTVFTYEIGFQGLRQARYTPLQAFQ